MDELQEQLRKRNKELEEVINYAKKILKNAPAGNLRISNRKNRDYYYVRDSDNHGYGRYIKKSNEDVVYELAQKDYAQKLLVEATKERDRIQIMLGTYIPMDIEKVYEALSSKRQKLVQPYFLPEDMYVTQWQSKIYDGKKQEEETDCSIITEKGEIVKSKSEKILADKFYLMNIPYHYEKPLYLNGYGTVYPDFLTLNKRKRKEIYWEHLGLMDKQDYCEKTIRKLETMQKNGIYLGENLIITFETQTHPLNMRIVEDMIKRYLV